MCARSFRQSGDTLESFRKRKSCDNGENPDIRVHRNHWWSRCFKFERIEHFIAGRGLTTRHALRQRRAHHLQLSGQTTGEDRFALRVERSGRRSWLLAISIWLAQQSRARISEGSHGYTAEVSIHALLSRAGGGDGNHFHDQWLRISNYRR